MRLKMSAQMAAILSRERWDKKPARMQCGLLWLLLCMSHSDHTWMISTGCIIRLLLYFPGGKSPSNPLLSQTTWRHCFKVFPILRHHGCDHKQSQNATTYIPWLKVTIHSRSCRPFVVIFAGYFSWDLFAFWWRLHACCTSTQRPQNESRITVVLYSKLNIDLMAYTFTVLLLIFHVNSLLWTITCT